jgi:hypothetical protein
MMRKDGGEGGILAAVSQGEIWEGHVQWELVNVQMLHEVQCNLALGKLELKTTIKYINMTRGWEGVGRGKWREGAVGQDE